MNYASMADLIKGPERLPSDCIIVLQTQDDGLIKVAVHRESLNGEHTERSDFRISGVSPEDIQEIDRKNEQLHIGWVDGRQVLFPYQWTT